MVDNIIDGISIKLNEVFGDEFNIYGEDIEQGLTEPCFFITCIAASSNQVVGKRYEYKQVFDIHYFAKQSEVHEVAHQLYSALEYITLDGNLIRGLNMHYEVSSGILHFFVNYNYQILKVSKQDAMEVIELNNKLKG